MHQKMPLSPSSHQFYDQQITHNKQQLQRKIFVQNYLLPNGSQYTGELINGKLDGQGVLKFPNKERYEGQFSKGKKHGKGKYYYKSGQYYIGDWIDNKKEGNGLYIYDKDKWYEGEFKNNMKHGRGIIKETNGNYYKGSFFQNNKDKEGQYFVASEEKTIKFIFDKGQQISASEQQNKDEMIQENKIDLPAIMKQKSFNEITSGKIVSQILQSYLNQHKSGSAIQNPNTSYISLHYSNEGTNSNEYSSKKNFISFPINEGPQIKNETLKSIKISEWDVNQVCEWLGDVGFGDYISQFRIHNISGFSLLFLNQQDLKQLNIASEQDRSVFLMQIKFLRLFFKTQCSKDSIVKFKNSDIDIQLLCRLSKQDPKRLCRHESMITQESSNSNFQQIEQQKMFKSLVKQVQKSNNLTKKSSDGSHDIPIEDRYSSSTSSSVQQGQQQKQKEEMSKKNDRNQWRNQIHRKIEYEMRKKRIDTKIVIPNSQIQLLKPIGKGSYGEVHLAAWNGQNIAIKIYTKRRGFRNRHISRFLQQAEIAIKLLHPFIVLYMGIFVNDNEYAIVMQYMEGGSLFDHLHIMGYKLNETKILSICKNVALGMVYLHGKNILHGDLKSSNLLLDKNWKIKISDFGLSYIKKGNLTKRPRLTRLGTPQWMAPETLKYGYYDFPCDVYSFGVVLWQLLTCQIPFRQLTEKQVFERAAQNETLTLQTPKHTNIKLVNLFKHCTSADPSSRPNFNEIYDYLSNSEKSVSLKLHKQA